MRREEFVQLVRTNILRIEVNEEAEKLLRNLQSEFEKCFKLASNFIKQYYLRENRLPELVDVYKVLRRHSAPSTIANETAKKVIEAWRAYIESRKHGYKAKPPKFKNIPNCLT